MSGQEAVETWRPLAHHPGLICPRAAFVSDEVGGRPSLFFVHDHMPGQLHRSYMTIMQPKWVFHQVPRAGHACFSVSCLHPWCLIFVSTDKTYGDTLKPVNISNLIFTAVHHVPVKSYFTLTGVVLGGIQAQ